MNCWYIYNTVNKPFYELLVYLQHVVNKPFYKLLVYLQHGK